MSRKGILNGFYNRVINTADLYVPQIARPLWESPAGPKTVFFWAPLGKWLLVIAGLGDILKRPPELISLNQSASLAATGIIWSRYSVVIIPKNYSLLTINAVVFVTQSFLMVKHLNWRYSNSPKAVHYRGRTYDK